MHLLAPFRSILLSGLLAASVSGQANQLVELSLQRCWTYSIADRSTSVLAVDSDTIYVGQDRGRVASVSGDGRHLWSSEFGGVIASNLLAGTESLFLVTSAVSEDDTKVSLSSMWAVSKVTGLTTKTLSLGNAERHVLASHNDSVIVVSSTGTVLSVDARSGLVRWRREIADGFVAEPYFNGTKLIVASRDKQVFHILLATGAIQAMSKWPYAVTAVGETWLGGAVIGDDRGNVILTKDVPGKKSWQFKTGAAVAEVSMAGPNLVVTSNDNFVYLVASRDGDVLWKRRLSGRPAYLSTIQRDYLTTAGADEHSVTIIELSTGKSVGQIQFAPGEVLTDAPIDFERSIVMSTNKGIYRYSVGSCTRQPNLPVVKRPSPTPTGLK